MGVALTVESFIAIMVAVFTCNGIWTFIGKIYETKSSRKSAMQLVVLALARDRLYEGCRHYISVGSIQPDALENLTSLYEAYRRMGGNSYGAELFHRVSALPLDVHEEE